MKSPPPAGFAFGRFRLDTESQILFCEDRQVHLPKRQFSILTYLIENRLRLVSRGELLDNFWDGHDVYDDSLRKCVGAIRKALRDDKKPPRFIETRYGGGYRFVADVTALARNGNGGSNGFVDHTGALNGNASKNGHHSLDSTPRSVSRRKSVLIFTAIMVPLVAIGSLISIARNTAPADIANTLNSAASIRSIAVMPLKNLTGEPQNDYFSDGITESIITELSRVDEVRVISRSSTFSLKDKVIDPREIGRQLGVDALLEGGVQGQGNTIHVNVRLISTRDGSVVWTSTDLERQFSDAYDLQNAIACNVADKISAELCGRGDQKIGDGFAYQEYLKGRYEWNKRTADGIRKSIEHYNKAIAIDPKYALAYSGLSESYLQGIWHVPFDAKVALPKAKKAGLRALELDPGLAEAHTAMANVYSLEWNWKESEKELDRAVELNPGFARTFHVQAFHFMLMGRSDESIAAIEKAEALDPLNMVIAADKGNLLLAAGRVDDAFRQWDKTLSMDPTFVMAYQHRAVADELTGKTAAAIDDNAAVMKLNGLPPEKIEEFRQLAGTRGMREVHRRELNDAMAKASRGEHRSPIDLALYHVMLGQKEKAFFFLEKAYAEHDPRMVLLPSPEFSSLRSDPRFTDLLRRVGFPG